MPTPRHEPAGPIDILLATHNGAAYLRPQIESLLAQDYPDFRILASDDGSTDGTPAILHEYAQRFLSGPRGCRGADGDPPEVHIVHRGEMRRITKEERQRLKRRQAIEPIGRVKQAVPCAAGYSIRWHAAHARQEGHHLDAAAFFAPARGLT